MAGHTQSIERLMDELAKLPGIGARSAERLAFHLLKADDAEALALADAIRDVKARIRPCGVCYNLAEDDRCAICSDPRRDKSVICVVEQPKDLLALESTGSFSGVYHVLLGQLSPLDRVEPEDLTIDALIDRAASGEVREVILATNPTVAGDATALHITDRLSRIEGVELKITRLARGLPTGGSIEYSNTSILADALKERRGI